MAAERRSSQLTWYHRAVLRLVQAAGPVPNHVAFIMDGNRRFAKQQHKPSVLEGHALGFDSLMLMLELCLELGVSVVTVYAFSEENFARPKEEVDGLMKLAEARFEDFIKHDHLVMQKGVQVNILGRVELLPLGVQRAAAKVVLGTRREPSSNSRRCTLNVCFAYSGTEEIAQAMRHVSLALDRGEIHPSDVNLDLLTRCTYLVDSSPPQLLIRTSGETRLSDFLLWHLAATKLTFIDVLWPELSIWDLVACVADWQNDDAAAAGDVQQQHERTLNSHVRAFLSRLAAERLARWEALVDVT